MKLKNTLYLLLITIVVAATACNQTSNSTIAGMSKEDSAKIAFYDKYFGSADFVPNEKNKPVDTLWAQKCVDLFKKLKGGCTDAELKRMFETESVSFKFNELTTWMADSLKGVKVDSMRVCLGVYEKNAQGRYTEIDKSLGKMTVFLWPYYNGAKAKRPKITNNKQTEEEEEVEPFNFGTLNP